MGGHYLAVCNNSLGTLRTVQLASWRSMKRDDDLRIRPGRTRATRSQRAKPFIAQALAAAEKAGGIHHRSSPSRQNGTFGRGRAASLSATRGMNGLSRVAIIKARVVRHGIKRTPLSAHLTYLRRDGVTKDGDPARMFGAENDDVDQRAFAERCDGDRHHFRFIVAPEDAAELSDIKAFTRDLMAGVEHDLGTRLDWVAVDHWNTEHPHIHVIVRGRTNDGDDLVISRDYIREGMRARAQQLLTLELGPRAKKISMGSRSAGCASWKRSVLLIQSVLPSGQSQRTRRTCCESSANATISSSASIEA